MSLILLFLEMHIVKRVIATWLALSTAPHSLVVQNRKTKETCIPLSLENQVEVGSRARRLAYYLNCPLPYPLSKLSRELMWSWQAFCLYQAFPTRPLSVNIQTRDAVLGPAKQQPPQLRKTLIHHCLQKESKLGAIAWICLELVVEVVIYR